DRGRHAAGPNRPGGPDNDGRRRVCLGGQRGIASGAGEARPAARRRGDAARDERADGEAGSCEIAPRPANGARRPLAGGGTSRPTGRSRAGCRLRKKPMPEPTLYNRYTRGEALGLFAGATGARELCDGQWVVLPGCVLGFVEVGTPRAGGPLVSGFTSASR